MPLITGVSVLYHTYCVCGNFQIKSIQMCTHTHTHTLTYTHTDIHTLTYTHTHTHWHTMTHTDTHTRACAHYNFVFTKIFVKILSTIHSYIRNKPSRYKIVYLINILSHWVYTDHHWTRGGMILSCGNIITAIISTTTTIMKCIIIIIACKCDITCTTTYISLT